MGNVGAALRGSPISHHPRGSRHAPESHISDTLNNRGDLSITDVGKLPFPKENMRRFNQTLILLTISLWVPLVALGQPTSAPTTEPTSLPTTSETVDPAEWYAATLPDSTNWVVVGRDFAALSDMFEQASETLSEVLDLRLIEAEVSATFGLTLDNPESFSDVGLTYDRGVAIANVAGQTVVLFGVNDKELALAQVTRVLQQQPFDLRATVITDSVGNVGVHSFAASPWEEADVAVSFHEGFGALVLAAETTPSVLDVAIELINAYEGVNLALDQHFVDAAEHLSDYPLLVAIKGQELDPVFSSVAIGLNMEEGLELAGLAALASEPGVGWTEMAQSAQELAVGDELLLPDAMFAARMSVDPEQIWDRLFELSQWDEVSFWAMVDPYLEPFGLSVRTDLLPHWTGNLGLSVGSIRLLSLASAETPGDVVGSLGLAIGAQIDDATSILTLLDDTGCVCQEQDIGVQCQPSDPTSTLRLVVVGDRLFFTDEQGSEDVLDRPADGNIADQYPESIAPWFVGQPALGVFTETQQWEPLTILLNWSETERMSVGLVSFVTGIVELTESGFLFEVRVDINESE